MIYFFIIVCFFSGYFIYRFEGSSRNLGNMGSGCSNSSCEGSIGISRFLLGRRRGRFLGLLG